MKRSPGRPRLDDDDASVKVQLTLTARDYDRTYATAQRERVTVQDVIRRAVHAAGSKQKKNIN
jgi:hypothetical protein